MKGLTKTYEDWSGERIGGKEVGVTLVNAIAPTFFPTIKSRAGECDQIGDKINGIETNAGDVLIELNKTIDAQEKLRKAIGD